MQNTNNKRHQTTPPDLLRGILTAVIGITISILAISWFIIDFHLEQLVIKRTSEYAHSIARIAADSSAEALLSDDKLQLNLLVENVAKDTYIRQATIISEDGQIVTQHPNGLDISSTTDKLENGLNAPNHSLDERNLTESELPAKIAGTFNNNEKKKTQFILRQRNKIFFEPINYQNITAGWFKLEIDKFKLEQDFREVFVDIQMMIAIVVFVLFSLLIFIVYKFDRSIKQLAINCQHLLIQKGIKPTRKKSSWLSSLEELSQSHQQKLHEHVSLPTQTDDWLNSRVVNNTLVCYLEFNLQQQENIDIAENLTQAEAFLNQSTQAFGVQSQGDILSGCLIPFVDAGLGGNQPLTEALSLVCLINKLFSLLSGCIQIKAYLLRAPVLYLEDEQDITTGISLMDRSLDKIKQLSIINDFGDILSIAIPPAELEETAEINAIICDQIEDKDLFKLVEPHSFIEQQIARKFKYISNKTQSQGF